MITAIVGGSIASDTAEVVLVFVVVTRLRSSRAQTQYRVRAHNARIHTTPAPSLHGHHKNENIEPHAKAIIT